MTENPSMGLHEMKNKIVALLLISGIAGSSFHLDEMTKLPLLVNHYREHRQTRDMSVFTFLYEHYVYSRQHPRNERDKRENEQLPFKSLNPAHQLAVACLFAAPPQEPGIPECRAEFSCYLIPGMGLLPFEIWQPPKLG